MKNKYIIPALQVDEAEIAEGLLVSSISLSDESGSEEYVKEQSDSWDIEW